MGVALVLTTVGDSSEAEAIARTLVDEHLAACVNILPAMQSIYRWKGEVQKESEQQLVIKTSADRLPALEQRLHALHPYELPEFVVVTADGASERYLAWVSAETGADG